MTEILPYIKDLGFPIALCVLLMWAIRVQYQQISTAYTDRISALESVVSKMSARMEEMEADRMKRSDDYSASLRATSSQWSAQVRENHALLTQLLTVMRNLVDSMGTRPCMSEYPPHSVHHHGRRVPSSADLPADPSKAPTDSVRSHA